MRSPKYKLAMLTFHRGISLPEEATTGWVSGLFPKRKGLQPSSLWQGMLRGLLLQCLSLNSKCLKQYGFLFMFRKWPGNDSVRPVEKISRQSTKETNSPYIHHTKISVMSNCESRKLWNDTQRISSRIFFLLLTFPSYKKS